MGCVAATLERASIIHRSSGIDAGRRSQGEKEKMAYIDSMDTDRVVVPNRSDMNSNIRELRCKIYYSGVYVGIAKIPRSLFVATELNERIGFVPRQSNEG